LHKYFETHTKKQTLKGKNIMAFKVGTVTVIDNSKQATNIENTDAVTDETIEDSIRKADNKIIIYNSAGQVIKTVYGPPEA
jgi:hypothetical protein